MFVRYNGFCLIELVDLLKFFLRFVVRFLCFIIVEVMKICIFGFSVFGGKFESGVIYSGIKVCNFDL